MSQGHNILPIVCSFCKGHVSDIDAVYDEGMSYHEHCYKLSISNEIKTYQKKVSLGTITLAESNRMNELQSTLNLVRGSDKRPISNMAQLKRKHVPSISRHGMSVFFSEERKQKLIEDQKKIKEYSLLIQAKIDEEKLIADKYNNTLVSTGKQQFSQAPDTPLKTAIFTPPETINERQPQNEKMGVLNL